MRVALVQGSIDQNVKWDPAWQERTLAIYQDLTVAAAREQPQLIVWPEAAVPFLLRGDPRRAVVEGTARIPKARAVSMRGSSRAGMV